MELLDRQPFPGKGPMDLVTWEDGSHSIAPRSEAKKMEEERKRREAELSASPEQWSPLVAKLRAQEQERQKLASNDYAPENMTRADAATPVVQAPPQDFGPPPPSPEPPQGSPNQAQRQAMLADAQNQPDAVYGAPADMVNYAFNAPVTVPGSPGRAARNAETEKSRYAERQARSRGTEGPDLTDEDKQSFIKGNAEASLSRHMAQDFQNQADMVQAQAVADQSAATTAMLQQRTEEKAIQQKRIEDEYAALADYTRKEVALAGNEEVDQGRFFSSLSAGKQFAFIVALAFSTYGSDDDSLGPMGKLIERDIDSQQARINDRRKRADNALSRLSERFGSVEAGRKALEAQQYLLGSQRVQELADRIGTQKASLLAQKFSAEAEAKAQESYNALRWDFVGKRQQQENDRYQDPLSAIAPTAASTRNPTFEEGLGRLEKIGGVKKTYADVANTEAGTAKTQAEVEAAKQSGGVGADPNTEARLSRDAAKDLGGLAQYRSSLERAMRIAGIEFRDGKPVKPEDIPGYGKGQMALSYVTGGLAPEGLRGFLSSEQGSALRKEIEGMLAMQTGKDISGAAYTEQMDNTIHRYLSGSNSDEAVYRGLIASYEALNEKEAALMADNPARYRRLKANKAQIQGEVGMPNAKPETADSWGKE